MSTEPTPLVLPTRAVRPAMPATFEPAPDAPLQLPDTNYHAVLRRGRWLLALGFGGFLAFAVLAPLDEGVPAPGVVAVESTRKRIDHLNGGLVEQIMVREGQRVKAGDELLVLNEAQSKSALNATQSQWYTAMASLARLRAESAGAAAISFPPELKSAAGEPEVAALMRAQEGLFKSRRAALDGELRIIRESVRGLEMQLTSLSQLKVGRETQIALFKEQLQSYRDLRVEGFVSRNSLLDLERQLAEVQSKQSEDLSNIAGINARLAEFRMRGAQREIEFRREVESQMGEVQREYAVLNERLAGQRDTFARLVLRAPVAGTVVDMAVHTVGGVVKPGDRLMDIVPDGDALVVEARIAPQYIDRVHPGLPADVHFDAYSSRAFQPVVSGQVAVVSADALTDARSGATYYTLRVTVAPAEVQKLGKLQLQPGMQTTVMVKTGERSLMVYLLRPLLRRFNSALAES
ncbi:HlyD family type I secretion periplasmic adaptor subunit [Rhodoferax sp.]|uniref:HlyD family type I secretion periplasmic adaptor subunit n=1 Tax=Rhodoferax sp. TaxID=50421 RepID=UPI002735B0D3|nr:HlyD family type I secretion periplasmic adaptor subunit [Rhodoferax sp.]MDP3191869.1 HlyD family type I secretion periplasmic adaptor subunit [Rhodoferax sp.]